MAQAVLGGGISGLATAYYLSKSAATKIKVFESSNRLGGWIQSVRSNNGALFELGPRMLRYGGEESENTVKLIEDLNLMSHTKPLPASSRIIKNRMLFLNNRLIKIPSAIKDYTTPRKIVEDESMYEFVSRRFGEGYASTVISALVCGIYAGDAREISVKAIWNSLFEMEQKYGSVLRGALPYLQRKKAELREKKIQTRNWSAWSFKGGLETLPVALTEYLDKANVELNLSNECSRVAFRGGKAIITVNGREETVDHLYSSVPSKDLAKILGPEHSFLKTQLSSIPFVSVGVVNLEFQGDLIRKKGFGFLVPPSQNLPILGITFDTCAFPQEGRTVLTVMMGGKWFEQHFGSNPEEGTLLQTALEYVKKILKIAARPVSSRVTIAKDCLPQYIVGHSKKVQEIRKYIAERKLPLTLIGSSFDGVGVNDAIFSAKTGVEKKLKL